MLLYSFKVLGSIVKAEQRCTVYFFYSVSVINFLDCEIYEVLGIFYRNFFACSYDCSSSCNNSNSSIFDRE